MIHMKKCPVCGGGKWDSGTIEIGTFPQSVWDNGIYYRSTKKKSFAGREPLFTDVCLQCGHMEIYIDYAHLRKSIKKQ